MKAPDKIYVPQHNIEAGSIQELDELIVAGSTEYIRKDALLEWLRNRIEQYNDRIVILPKINEESIKLASSISSLLEVIARIETL